MTTSIDQIIRGAVSTAAAGSARIALPQVSLLPVEIKYAARGRTTRVVLAGGVGLAVVIAAGATAIAALAAAGAQARVDDATSQTQTLTAQVAKFSDIQKLQKSLAVEKAAAEVGASTEVDWEKQMGDIERDMPYGYTVTGITTTSATPFSDYDQGDTPLEQPRAATVQLTASAPTITDLPVWLRELRSIPAYADATASVQQESDSGGYTVSLTVHLSPKAEVRLAGEGQ